LNFARNINQKHNRARLFQDYFFNVEQHLILNVIVQKIFIKQAAERIEVLWSILTTYLQGED